MEFLSQLNWVAIIVGSAVAYIVGGFWYSPKLFGTTWMEAQPHRDKSDYKYSASAMVIQAAATLLTAVVTAGLVVGSGAICAFVLMALMMGFGMWSGGLFMGQNQKLMLINIGNVIVSLVIMAGTHLVI